MIEISPSTRASSYLRRYKFLLASKIVQEFINRGSKDTPFWHAVYVELHAQKGAKYVA